MTWILDPNIWIGLITLTLLEIILGIDNIILISILSEKLPAEKQPKARYIGLSLALITRILFLLFISWLTSLERSLFSFFSLDISIRDIILIVGGLFLLAKSTNEIHREINKIKKTNKPEVKIAFSSVIFQIVVMDVVFSIDSVITAIGMVRQLPVMIAAIIISIVIMIISLSTISNFIAKHQSLKILALSFLLVIGVTLISEGLGFYIPKGYIYFAMGFAGIVETLNIITETRKKQK